MKVKVDYISDQFCQMYFHLDSDEAQVLFEKYETDPHLRDEEVEKVIKFLLEKLFINDKIEEEGFIQLYESRINFINPLEKGKPINGIAKILIYNSDFDLSIPKAIPKNLLFKYPDEAVLDAVDDLLIGLGYFNEEKGEKVSRNSLVIFDRLFIKDGKVIKIIENQKVNIRHDVTDYQFALLDRKIGRRFKYSEVEGIVESLKIKEIIDSVAYELTDELAKKIHFCGTKTKVELIDKVRDILTTQKNIFFSAFFVIEAASSYLLEIIDDDLKNFIIDNKKFESDEEKNGYLKGEIETIVGEYIIITARERLFDSVSPKLKDKFKEISKFTFMVSGKKISQNDKFRLEEQEDYGVFLQFCIENGLINNLKII